VAERKSHMKYNGNSLKSINVIHYDGISINLNEMCMSYTNFQPNQVLEAAIYGDMIVITTAIKNNPTS
jgi:hypothetical protein